MVTTNGDDVMFGGANRSSENGCHLDATPYERLMGRPERGDGSGTTTESECEAATGALSSRLVTFRKWLEDDAKVQVHPAICIVNGEATDGTRQAPVLVFEKSSEPVSGAIGAVESNTGRVGAIDWEGEQRLYDRTMGCQIRAVREIKANEVVMTMPRGAFVTPDLVASSDAGRAILACCRIADGGKEGRHFWDAFENTTVCEAMFNQRMVRSTAPQLLVKLLQERKRIEAALNDRNRDLEFTTELIPQGQISTRAPLLAFLIQQRFANVSHPPVASDSRETDQQFQHVMAAEDANALRSSTRIVPPPGSPNTFAPYARTLPSFVSIPICWKRSELALLASSLPGIAALHDATIRTLQLASEFKALLDAGVLQRFPATFPPGLLTWERWVWAAAIVSSRSLPAISYANADEDVFSFNPKDCLEFQSRPDVWQEVGVLIPMLDMLNHESEAHQVTWEPSKPATEYGSRVAQLPRAITHKKVKKGSELFCCYGTRSNSYLIQQYGFAQLNNPCDEVKLGWGLMDAVGHLDQPTDYSSPFSDDAVRRFLVFDTVDEGDVAKWWSDERLELLKKEALRSDDSLLRSLKDGKKMTALAYSDGSFHPILLTVLVVATMPKIELQKLSPPKQEKIVLSKRHQQVFRSYLNYFFSRKLEKLLQNVCAGLKDHFKTDKIWSHVSNGGLNYTPDESESEYTGWQSFLDTHIYKTTMKVENNYYAMGAESCVLALFDGNLRALQKSIDAVADEAVFTDNVLSQIEELGFGIATEKDDSSITKESSSAKDDTRSQRPRKANKQKDSASMSTIDKDRPKAVKLHLGNLSFATTPSDMYDYFSSLYGKDSILECHIPVERDTGRSRGFGFVTLPEDVANRVLKSTVKHELGGRLVKLSKSNTAGTSVLGRTQLESVSSERCASCGYRPKYCTCPNPSHEGSRQDSKNFSRESISANRKDDRDYFGHTEAHHREGRHAHQSTRGTRHDFIRGGDDSDRRYHRSHPRAHSYTNDRDYSSGRGEVGLGPSTSRGMSFGLLQAGGRWEHDDYWRSHERERGRKRSRSTSRDRYDKY